MAKVQKYVTCGVGGDCGHCGKCRRAKSNKMQPIKAKYNRLKYSAKSRGIDITLTLEEFEKFCKETDYIKRCGRKKNNLTIDRKNNNSGYHYWNIQALTKSCNILKYYNEDRYNRELSDEDIADLEAVAKDQTPIETPKIELDTGNEIIMDTNHPPHFNF